MDTKTRWTKHVAQPNARQQRVLDGLAEHGGRRGELVARKAYTTTAGRIELDRIYAKLRELIERGEQAGLGNVQMRETLGVNSSAYFKIKRGATGSGA
jgi:hypothetical protein